MKKKGFLGILIIGGSAAVLLVVLLLVNPSCAGADAGDAADPLDAPPAEPAEDPRLSDAQATAEAEVAASVSATVAASTSLTAADVAAQVEAALATREAGMVADESRRPRLFARTPLPPGFSRPAAASPSPDEGCLGDVPLFPEGWEGNAGSLVLYEDQISSYSVLRPELWLSHPSDDGSRFADPGGLAYMEVVRSDAPAGGSLPELAAAWRSGLEAESAAWGFSDISDVASADGSAGFKHNYLAGGGGAGCAYRVFEAWYGPLTPERGSPSVYVVLFAYCACSVMDFGGYAEAVLSGFQWKP